MRVVITEDEDLFREFLKKFLERELGYEIVGEAKDGITAVELCQLHKPDLLLLDIMLPHMDGIQVAKQLLSEDPLLKILILSSSVNDYSIHRIFQLSICGFLSKISVSIETLSDALRSIAVGKPYFCDMVLRRRLEIQNDPDFFSKVLSERELQMFLEFTKGLSNLQIARKMGLSPLTVQAHRRSVMKKLNLHSVKELMRYAQDRGFMAMAENIRGCDEPKTLRPS